MGIFSDEKYRPSESRILATALTFSAGFIDAYIIFNGDILYLLGRQETSSSLRQHLLTIILQVC